MAIRAGQFLHDVHGYVIDRIQTGGVSNLNIPTEKIHELGNYQTVATVRDIPDLSFDIETLDVSTELEALITGIADPTTVVNGQELSFDTYTFPIDVISPFKSFQGAYDIVRGVAVPYLTLDTVAYKFAVKQNSSATFTLRGSDVYYIQGTPYQQDYALTSGTSQSYSFAHTALPYSDGTNTVYAYSVCVRNPSTGHYKRLFIGDDFTNTNAGITILADQQGAGYTRVRVVYGSATAATYDQTVHETVAVKPAAVRAHSVDIYVSDGAATPTLVRLTGVQAFDVSRKVNLEADEEFGNFNYVSQDYDTADVTGSIDIKGVDAAYLWSKISQFANVSGTDTVGTKTSTPLALECRIKDPDTGTVLKTLYVPDARFTPPAMQGRVQQKLTVKFPFDSDTGVLQVYKGSRS